MTKEQFDDLLFDLAFTIVDLQMKGQEQTQIDRDNIIQLKEIINQLNRMYPEYGNQRTEQECEGRH